MQKHLGPVSLNAFFSYFSLSCIECSTGRNEADGEKTETDMDLHDADRYLVDSDRKPAFFIRNSEDVDERVCTDSCL